MKRHRIIAGPVGLLVALGLVLTFGCSSWVTRQTVHAGDRVQVHLTCRLNGETLVYSSLNTPDGTMEPDPNGIFFSQTEPGPVELIAGSADSGPMQGNLKSFEGEMKARVAVQLPGMGLHEKRTLALDTVEPQGLTDADRYLTLTTKRRYTLVRTVGRIPLTKQLGKEPEPGMAGPSMGPLSTLIRSVQKDQVDLEFVFNDGDTLEMPFGPGVLSHDGDRYVITIQARVGHPVKTAMLLGQIVRVEDDHFVIDYGHPFGGRSLACDVEILSINPRFKE